MVWEGFGVVRSRSVPRQAHPDVCVSRLALFASIHLSAGVLEIAALPATAESSAMNTERKTIVAFGASITFGTQVGERRSWPHQLADRLAASRTHFTVVNKGIPGNRLLVDGMGRSALARFDQDVLAVPNIRWVIFSDNPINDIGMASKNLPHEKAPSAQTLAEAVGQLSRKAHFAGLRFFCSTLTPYEGASYWTANGEKIRQEYNSLLRDRTTKSCDGVIDQDMALRDPYHQSRLKPEFDSGDHLHPSTAGHTVIARSIDLRLFSAK